MSINLLVVLGFQYFLSQFGNQIIITPQFGSVFNTISINNNVQNAYSPDNTLNYINNALSSSLQLEYHKYLIGVNVGLYNTGFEYYLPNNSAYIATSRMAIGLGMEIPISMFSITRYEVGDSFWDYFHEEEKEKKLHFQPNLGIEIGYLFNVSGFTKQYFSIRGNEIEYRNNLNSSILIRPYVLVSIKNADVEYFSLSLAYSLGLLPVEELRVKDEIGSFHRFTSTNSTWTLAINRKFYWSFPKGKLRNKTSKGKYNGQCPKH